MQYRGVAQFGRAPRSGRGGRKFKSCHLDQEKAGSLTCFYFMPECPQVFITYNKITVYRHLLSLMIQ